MKKTNLINSLFVVALAILFSTSVFAQEKPSTEKSKECCSSKTAKHVCTDECKTAGCDVVKTKEARAALDVNNDGYIYECSMKCDASDNAGECSKCGMDLKKVSVKES